ncbi:MAG: acetate/propionate family kinase [Bacteroidia bacterium]
MNILVINSGSSSVKVELIDTLTSKHLQEMRLSGLTNGQAYLQFDEEEALAIEQSSHEDALRYAFPLLQARLAERQIQGIGHRVVHGGEAFGEPTLITAAVLEILEELTPLAPLHNPVNLLGIEMAQEVWPELPHVAIFDTAFHRTLPRRAQLYALPLDLQKKHGIRRYGFHGTSHSYVARKAAEFLGFPLQELRLITCHLGNGASICAVEYGRSVETSMGLTPLEGLVMGTRSGDLDPGVLTLLQEREGLDATGLDDLLNRESGLMGLAGTNDMRELEKRSAEGDEKARTAIQIYTHRLRKYIGAYAAILGGVDAIVFTGGVGENSAVIRERVAQRLEFLGAILDQDANRDADRDARHDSADISAPHSRCKMLVVPTDEQFEIARQAAIKVRQEYQVKDHTPSIPVAISARHVHLTRETVDQLFGEGHELTLHKWLSQPGQFAAKERVTIIGPKNQIERVRILGPLRSKDQVEISRTDEFVLGIDAPVRASGHVENTPGITLAGPNGKVRLQHGVICAWRHIHMTTADAERFGVEDKDLVEVRVASEDRSLTFGNVLIRVSDKYKLEMHIDTDEGNAAELRSGDAGVLWETSQSGSLVKRERVESKSKSK